MRPLTRAAVTALVVSSACLARTTTVFADESNDESDERGADQGHRATRFRNIENRSRIHLEGPRSSDHGHPRHREMVAAEEDLMPGLAYVALAGLTGSVIARQRSALLKVLSPFAFASAAGLYFLPHTTRNLLGVDQSSYDKWASSHPHSHAHPHATPSISATPAPNSELVSKARDAWHTAETKVDQLDNKVDSKARDMKQWWDRNTAKAEQDLKAQVSETKSWVESKATEADRALDQAQATANDAVKKTKGWVEDKSRLVERQVGTAAKEVDGWRSQAASSMRSTEDKTWLHHKADQGPAPARDRTTERKHWWSSRSKPGIDGPILGSTATLGTDSSNRDHWSNGEEQGTAEVREADKASWFRGSFRRAAGSDGHLDNKDVDNWSSTGEEIGTAKLDSEPFVHMHRQRFVSREDLPHEPEYWSNGEEVSSADIRDANYYNYAGSLKTGSLGRTSWWDRRSAFAGASSNEDNDMSNLKEKAELLSWEAKQAAEKAASDIASKLAREQSELEKKTADVKARAEAAARQARATSDALIRERQQAMEKSTRDLEMRINKEKEAADRVATDAKARARAWELDQQSLADKAAREVQDRVAREKAAAEASAAQVKAKAEAWAREQKAKADQAAKEVHDRFLRETAAAEKAASEAKSRAESLLKEKKYSAERASRELADAVARESAAKIDREKQLRAQMEGLKAELQETTRAAAEIEASTGRRWGWSRSPATEVVPEQTSTSSSTKRTRGESQEGFDSTGQLLDHIAEDIKQTKGDIEQGLGHLKDAVLGVESKASDAVYKTTETVRGAVNRASSDVVSAAHDKATTLGRNVEREAVKAEVDVRQRAKAAEKNPSETARKAHDNVIDAAANIEGQMRHPHRHHDHSAHDSDAFSHHLYSHIRDDVRQTKEDIQHGMDHLRGAFHGAEQATNAAQANAQQARDDSRKWWNSRAETLDQDQAQAKASVNRPATVGREWWRERSQKLDQEARHVQDKVDKAAAESKSWWESKTSEAESKARLMEGELRAGLNKAGDKVLEMERGLDESLNPASREASDDYWFHVEQNRQQQQYQQQQQRRGSGRAM
ncbi:hypothetical protein BGZ67_004245 [Mortierella alpina]|nr:hypothetical protein BGZ67_004245 [Mortierella alpina]